MDKKVKINSVVPNQDNPRYIKDDKFKALVKSIKDFPEMLELRPIVVNKDMIILGGNMRYKACLEAGVDEIPVIIAENLTEEQEKEFVIKDNVPGGEWDWDKLANEWEVEQLGDWGLDIPVEFGDDEVVDGLTDEDDVPNIQQDPITKEGDLYILGDHRLLCGDSTNIQHVERLMGGKFADMLITDPHYNVDYTGKTKDSLKIENDKKEDAEFRQFIIDAFVSADSVMNLGAVFYIWHADSEGYNFRGACHEIGWKVRQCLIWNKNSMVMGRQDYHWKHEPCLYGWKDGASHKWESDRKQTTILEFDRQTRNKEHPTMKPVDLIEYQVKNNTKKNDIVLDIFGGSGTTIIASEKTKRKCRMVELDPKYCDVIVKRWEDFTGKKAELVSGVK